jgi:hypothetical protein
MWSFINKVWTFIFGSSLDKQPVHMRPSYESQYKPPNYETCADEKTDMEVAAGIREMGLLLGHSRRMYNRHITSDKEDDVLKRYFLASLVHYPTRGERLREIWDSGSLDHGTNELPNWREPEDKEACPSCGKATAGNRTAAGNPETVSGTRAVSHGEEMRSPNPS